MKLLLATLLSKYIHSSLALPTIAAACSKVPDLETVIREHTVNERPSDVLRSFVSEDADIAAFSCYIWNIEQTLRLSAEMKLLNPGLFVIFGGPEASYGSHDLMSAHPHIDLIVHGEGEETMAELMQLLVATSGSALPDDRLSEVSGISFRSGDEIITTRARINTGSLDSSPSPFVGGFADLSKPLVYIETSRGCPFSCAFCLSSVENGVRSFSFERIEQDLKTLMDQGVETVKFVDRTFNYDAERANRIWEFILAHNRKSRFHFEIAADLLTDGNIDLLKRVPEGTFRFEIGVQSIAAETLETVGRRSDLERLFANVERLKEETGIIVHLDLVAGLPGEDLDGFVRSMERLIAARPHHIQVEPLKLLKGTAMRKIARDRGYTYTPFPPYRILTTPWLSFADVCRIEDCSEALEEIYNSGRFAVTLEMVSKHHPLTTVFTSWRPAKSKGSRLSIIFEQFLNHLKDLFPELSGEIIETLRFDYCMSGHPGHSLPPSLQYGSDYEDRSGSPVSHKEIAKRLSLTKESRFRTFSARFSRDYTAAGWSEGDFIVMFVYCSSETEQKILHIVEKS
jgi:anaerobic magnesium-protoporphyrin IX monomethyl ester cyclase